MIDSEPRPRGLADEVEQALSLDGDRVARGE